MAITRTEIARQLYRDAGYVEKAYEPSTTAKAPPSMGFGNPPPSDKVSGGDEPSIVIPKTLKKGVDLGGEVMFLKNLFDLNPVGVMKNIGSKVLMDKLISEADTEDDNNMLLADVSATDINRLIGAYGKPKYNPAQDVGDIRQFEKDAGFEFNPTMTDQEIIDVLNKKITKPTGKFAADGGRIGAAEGGIMDLETGRQMYGLGKLVKKITRGVKKIAKSPIGKAALFAAPFAFNPAARGAIGSFFGKGSFNPFKAVSTIKGLAGPRSATGLSGLGKLLTKIPGINTTGLLSGNVGVGAAISAASLLPLLGIGTGDETEDEAKQLIADNTGLNFDELRPDGPLRFAANGGLMRLGYQEGSKEPVAKETMPLLDMGGKEMDLREDGGFVPIGRMEKADDVPARLSKNEFVFTAEAVRNAGDGDVDKGSEVMYNMMKNLESGGDVSEESQGLEGARKMFQTSQRLEEVL